MGYVICASRLYVETMIRTSIEFIRGYLPLVTAIHEVRLKHPAFVTKRKARCLLNGGSCNDSEEWLGATMRAGSVSGQNLGTCSDLSRALQTSKTVERANSSTLSSSKSSAWPALSTLPSAIAWATTPCSRAISGKSAACL